MSSHLSLCDQTKQRWLGSFQPTDSNCDDCLSSWKEQSLSVAKGPRALYWFSGWSASKNTWKGGTDGEKGWTENLSKGEDGGGRQVGETVRSGDASLLMRFLLTGCGGHWIAEAISDTTDPPLLLPLPIHSSFPTVTFTHSYGSIHGDHIHTCSFNMS